jgi:hypothetical protein
MIREQKMLAFPGNLSRSSKARENDHSKRTGAILIDGHDVNGMLDLVRECRVVEGVIRLAQPFNWVRKR